MRFSPQRGQAERWYASLQSEAFDADYIEALRAGNPQVQEHFVCYLSDLLHLKLRSRLRTSQAIEDVRQETFTRVFLAIRKEGSLLQPGRLGPFVNTICNNVLLEHYRQAGTDSLDDEGAPEPPASGTSVLDAGELKQMSEHFRRALADLGQHERTLLKAIFLDDRDRDEVCREFGVNRDYLRVLLHRAKHAFKASYLKRSAANCIPSGSTAENRVRTPPAEHLSVAETEGSQGLVRVLARAEYVWDDHNKASEWMNKPHSELHNATPIETARTELGARRVEALLDKLLFGLPV